MAPAWRFGRAPDHRPLLVLIDLVQDFDVLSPVLIGLRDAGETPRIVVSRWLLQRAPRIADSLRSNGLSFETVSRPALLSGRRPDLAGVRKILTASESSAGPHRWVRALVQRAREAGVRAFTLQHGVDNLESLGGPADSRLDFISDVMFCWPPAEAWPADIPDNCRGRLAPVGRPSLLIDRGDPDFDVGVFENLHARRYDDDDRRTFLETVERFCRARPGLKILLRAHPAGGWLDGAGPAFKALANVTFVASGAARRDPAPGVAAAAAAARVITTPSTVALDAAQCGRQVALAMDGGRLYAPLPVLQSLADWLAFADGSRDVQGAASAFLARHDIGGPAVGRIVARLAKG